MIYSMTGYGAGESDINGVRTTVELRSVNGRFCDITVRMPKPLGSLEGRVRGLVQGQITRGNISVSIKYDECNSTESVFQVDIENGRKYCESLRKLRDNLGISGDVTLDMLASYPGLVTFNQDEVNPEDHWDCIETALSKAIFGLKAMKQREGEALEEDLQARIKQILGNLNSIEEQAPERVSQFEDRLKQRLGELLEKNPIDPQRVAMEITLFAERTDITEECVRLRSHCDTFLEFLTSDGSPGRRLNFLIQEMNREINTIGSKGNDTAISHSVIDIKEELEKVREQVQNIE